MSFPRYAKYRDSGVEWLGEVPEDWQVVPLRSLAKPGADGFTDGDWIESPHITDEGVRLLQTGNIGVGRFREQGFRYVSEQTFKKFGCTEINPGDVLICRLADPVGRACIAPSLGCRMITSVDVCILKLKPDSVAGFLVYFLSGSFYLSFMDSASRGGTRERVSRSFLGGVRVLAPCRAEQLTIAGFLDHETAKIDTLVHEQQQLIELLKEKRQAVISHAVTKGLDPDGPMKESGVEWLGEVPAHWAVLPLKRGLVFLTSGSRGWAKHYADDGALFIRIGNLTRESIHLNYSDLQYVEVPEGAEGERTRIIAGDVLFSITAYLGSVAVAPDLGDAYVSQHVALARLDQNFIVPEWLAYVTLSEIGRNYLAAQGYGGTKIQLSLDDVAELVLPVPPRMEQIEVLAVISKQVDKVDELIEEAERAIELLRERRSALISAAVTGKIDVRGWEPSAGYAQPNASPVQRARA